MSAALDGLRVVELTGPLGHYCGKLLADLGAEVILAEPAGGAPERARLPLTPGGDSLWFTYHNAGKRSCVIDDDAQLMALLQTADILVGNGSGDWPERWRLDLAQLMTDKPDLVIVSITPFGLDGPYSDYEGTDLICLAMGGLMSLGGYGDGAPIRAAGDQALTGAASFAAVGAMLAILHAEQTGTGQLVDVSCQESVSMALENAVQYYDLEGITRTRTMGRQRGAGAGIYRCADGWVYLFVGGIASNRFWVRFIDWLREEGAEGLDELTGTEWDERAYFDTPEARATFLRVFERFIADRKKEDLYREAQSRGIVLTPVRTIPEVVASEQLAIRGFFTEISGPHDLRAPAPGAPYRFSETPWRVQGPAPMAGEWQEVGTR